MAADKQELEDQDGEIKSVAARHFEGNLMKIFSYGEIADGAAVLCCRFQNDRPVLIESDERVR